MQKILHINPDKCTGCLQCEMACSFENYGTFATAKSRIKVFDFHETGKKVPYTCTQCDEAWCLHACPVEAITHDKVTGAMVVNETTCVGCKVCTIACPFGTINYVQETGKVQKCDLCGGDPACASACPTGAITFVDANWTGLDKMKQWADKLGNQPSAAQLTPAAVMTSRSLQLIPASDNTLKSNQFTPPSDNATIPSQFIKLDQSTLIQRRYTMRTKIMISSVAVLLGLSGMAHAEGLYVSGSVGAVVPHKSDFEFGATSGVSGLQYKGSYKTGYGANLAMGYGFSKVRVEGEFGYKMYDMKDLSYGGETTSLNSDLKGNKDQMKIIYLAICCALVIGSLGIVAYMLTQGGPKFLFGLL